jgi:hypothetical protein
LQNSKDAVAQAQAVAGLAAQLGSGSGSGSSREQQQQGSRVDDYIITILSQVMRDDGYFCRWVRHATGFMIWVFRVYSAGF